MVKKVTKGQLSKLQKAHKTDSRIGSALGLSRQSVHQLRKKLGVRTASADKPSRDAEIAAAYIAGETGIAIAKKFGVSISQTYRIINAANGKAKRKAAVKRLGPAAPKASGKKASAKKSTAPKAISKKSPIKKKAATKKAVPAKKKIGKKRSKKR